VSDIDTAVLDGLKVLDPNGRLEKLPRQSVTGAAVVDPFSYYRQPFAVMHKTRVAPMSRLQAPLFSCVGYRYRQLTRRAHRRCGQWNAGVRRNRQRRSPFPPSHP